MWFEAFDIYKLLNYGTGTAIALVLVFFVIKTLTYIVNIIMDNQKEITGKQSSMMQEMGNTLKDVAGTLLVIQDNIKDLQEGQNDLWKEVRHLKKGGRKEDEDS
ncbi:hypothetical protein ABE236_18380 [Priestia endophytica]|uniref:hypothetical protein n=1 Tax=Priestia endophytica TaxID=135735 RepID=UPI003D2CFBC5